MKRMMLSGLLFGWALLATAEPLPSWHNTPAEQAERVGQVLDTDTGLWLSADELVKRLAPAEHVLVGEQHDNVDHHQLQLWLLQRLQEQRPQASLLLEMLTPSQQSAVDSLQNGDIEAQPEQLAEQLNWSSGWDWNLYGPIVTWVLQSDINLRAANLDREEIRTLYRTPVAVSPRYSSQALAELRETIEASHCGQIAEPQLSAMRGVQQQRDVRMGEQLTAAPAPALLLAGNFHVRKDLGVPLHLDGAAPIVVMLQEVGKPMPGAEQADYLWLTPAAPEQDHCAQWQQSGD